MGYGLGSDTGQLSELAKLLGHLQLTRQKMELGRDRHEALPYSNAPGFAPLKIAVDLMLMRVCGSRSGVLSLAVGVPPTQLLHQPVAMLQLH